MVKIYGKNVNSINLEVHIVVRQSLFSTVNFVKVHTLTRTQGKDKRHRLSFRRLTNFTLLDHFHAAKTDDDTVLRLLRTN